MLSIYQKLAKFHSESFDSIQDNPANVTKIQEVQDLYAEYGILYDRMKANAGNEGIPGEINNLYKEHKGGFELSTYLIKPVQRMTKYPLLMGDFSAKLDRDQPKSRGDSIHASAEAASKTLTTFVVKVNSQVKMSEAAAAYSKKPDLRELLVKLEGIKLKDFDQKDLIKMFATFDFSKAGGKEIKALDAFLEKAEKGPDGKTIKINAHLAFLKDKVTEDKLLQNVAKQAGVRADGKNIKNPFMFLVDSKLRIQRAEGKKLNIKEAVKQAMVGYQRVLGDSRSNSGTPFLPPFLRY